MQRGSAGTFDLGVASEVGDRPEAPEENWTTIWSRFPIQPLAATSDPARSVSALVSVPGGPPLVVYGTVLPWLNSCWGADSNGSTPFERALDAQSADWARLRVANPEAEFCVAGDLNQDLAQRHYYGSRRHRIALESSLGRVGLTCLTAAPRDPVNTQTRGQHAAIDHICVSSGLVARAIWPSTCWPETSEPDPTLSDHFGVCVEFADA